MARIAGRNLWIAVPAGLACIGIVGALAWLSQPMLPVASAWVGAAVHNATNMTTPQPTPASAEQFSSTLSSDCRALYPDKLWAELTWTPDVLLAQTSSAPATSVTALTDALAPQVRVTCAWRAPNVGSISTTISAVAPDAATIAQAALQTAGFDCETGAMLECSLTQGDVVEEHALRDGLWISSVQTSWHPKNYGSRLAQRVWG